MTLKPTVLETRATETLTRGAGLLTMLGVTKIPAGPIGLLTSEAEWVVVAAEDDPHLAASTFVVPGPVLERLKSLNERKVPVDRLFVAHELPAGSLSKAGSKLAKHDLATIVPAGAPDPRLTTTLGRCNRIVGMAAKTVVAPFAVAGAGASAIAAGLDPALMAVVTASGRAAPGELAVWFLIAAWT